MYSTFVLFLLAVPSAFAKVQYMGMNIAGFDFGCQIDGTCPLSSIQPPLKALGGADGVGQMQHFLSDDQMNIFRFPVSWQFLVNNQLGGTLDSTNLGKYDQLMQACLSTTAYCAIDIHNFARFNGGIIGQGGPTDAQFADLWTQLAAKYGSNDKVVFGLMNEPHDLDVPTWANSVQAAVTAIRNAGASSQMILLPGTNFTSAGAFVSSGSAAALSAIKNPDGSTTGLILDVHKYLDVDNSGEHAECTTDNIADAFAIVADFLRDNGRTAMVSETGAGSTSSCFTDFCAQNTFLNQNSDVFLGYIAWAAGSFSSSYVLSLTPTEQNGKFVDNALASQCVVAPWLDPSNTVTFVSSAITSNVASLSAAESTSMPSTAATTGSVDQSTSTAKATFTSANTSKPAPTNKASGNSSRATGSSTATISAQTQSTSGAEMRKFACLLLAGSVVIGALL